VEGALLILPLNKCRPFSPTPMPLIDFLFQIPGPFFIDIFPPPPDRPSLMLPCLLPQNSFFPFPSPPANFFRQPYPFISVSGLIVFSWRIFLVFFPMQRGVLIRKFSPFWFIPFPFSLVPFSRSTRFEYCPHPQRLFPFFPLHRGKSPLFFGLVFFSSLCFNFPTFDCQDPE